MFLGIVVCTEVIVKYCMFQCSVSCGKGQKLRAVTCLNSQGDVVEDNLCKTQKPKIVSSCRHGRCPHWTTSPWGQVSYRIGKSQLSSK